MQLCTQHPADGRDSNLLTNGIVTHNLLVKGDGNLIITMFYMKDLNKP